MDLPKNYAYKASELKNGMKKLLILSHSFEAPIYIGTEYSVKATLTYCQFEGLIFEKKEKKEKKAFKFGNTAHN